MQTSPKGVAEIAGHEGIVLSPYLDSVGTWTFGVGHTRAAGPPNPAVMEKGARQPLDVAGGVPPGPQALRGEGWTRGDGVASTA